jgi:TolB-like protein/tetratricopeptide (TPR) repeat protein
VLTVSDPIPVREELDRILTSAGFRQSESLQRMLRFVVEATLEGRQHQLKERTIGTDVFGRGDDFDPRLDAIVRVQARKLRGKLSEYYQADGHANQLRIEVAKGSYVPSFIQAAIEMPAAGLPDDPAPEPALPTTTFPWKAVAAILLLCAAVAVAVWRIPHRPVQGPTAPVASPLPPSIAVLPFLNVSGDPKNDYLSDGLSEELLNALTRVEGLKVVARSSSFQFRTPGIDVRQIGAALQVRDVLEGSVRGSAGQVRVTARLIDAATGYQVWSETYDRPSSDVLKLEDDLARAIVTRMRVRMTGAAQAPPAVNPEAYDEFLKARFFLRTPAPDLFLKARTHAEAALRIDPHFAAALAALATTYSGAAAYGFASPHENWVKGREIAQKALAIDPTVTEALIVMSGFQAWHEWDYQGAEYRYRQVLDLAPGDARYRTYYASFLGAMGRQQDARREMQRALDSDPLSMQVRYGVAQLHYFWREYALAAAMLETSIKTDPEYGMSYRLLGLVYAEQGRFTEALEYLDLAQARMPGLKAIQGERAYVLGLAGRKLEARTILNRLLRETNQGYFSEARIADAYLGVDEPENALVWIDKAIESRAFRPGWLQVDPRYSRLLRLPDAQRLLRKTHLISQ